VTNLIAEGYPAQQLLLQLQQELLGQKTSSSGGSGDDMDVDVEVITDQNRARVSGWGVAGHTCGGCPVSPW
jgi:hypothetical protein